MIIVLLGPPGSGKGTQGSRLAHRLDLRYLASGDLFRRAIAANDEVGRKVQHYVERGFLVPDDLTLQVVMGHLQQPEAAAGVILDGFPRTRRQAEALNAALADRQQRVAHVLYLDVPSDVLTARLSGRWLCRKCQAVYHMVSHPPQQAGQCDVCGGELYQRPDDQPERVSRRLHVYRENTVPLVAYYRQQGVLREINGNQSVGEVTAELLSAVQQFGEGREDKSGAGGW